LAAVAVSSAAFAQVTVGGVLDVSAYSSYTAKAMANSSTTVVTTKSSETGRTTSQGMATSELRFAGTEDLEGGLKASFQLNSDLRTPVAFASRDRWAQLSGGFGSIRLGSQGNVGNSAGFNAYATTATTGVGSIYGIAINGGIERQNNVINYTSPSMGGVTVVVGTARNSSDSDAADGENTTVQNGLSVTYAAGPLSIGAGMTDRNTKTQFAAVVNEGPGVAGSAAVAVSDTQVDANYIGASYNLGVASVSAVMVNNKSTKDDVVGRDLSLTAFGVTVPMGKVSLRASMYSGKDTVTVATNDDIKHSGYQISAVYAMSKRTSAYAYTGENTTKRTGGNTTKGDVAKTTGMNFGVMHSF
jgi:predicted porin